MELIGYYAWRVLQNARKAAIARQKENADAEMRGPALSKVEREAPPTRRQGASADTEELGGQAFAPGRTRT
ncbi:hypothetical protein DKP76_11600 [Falsochrobactrum shanghaiense]|uniref:Uncharacterized protein n=1 Tax=Falsochrobactrum shanghaiense TaxID=2201899 RepID=A0A316J7U8_9HYPH|nr:hypothetical protein DKP76_11600 [Falsochrobactrum shanghaiense]